MSKMIRILIFIYFLSFSISEILAQTADCSKCLGGVCNANQQCDDCLALTWDLPLCHKFCNCKNNVACDTNNGACPNDECDEGFGGSACQNICGVSPYPNKFGSSCTLDCHCKDKGFGDCNSATGVCTANGCDQGWKNNVGAVQNCQTPCDNDEWDFGCTKNCFCRGGVKCTADIGKCPNDLCAAGFKGQTCSTPCDTAGAGEFGENCVGKCRCRIGNNDCNSKDGSCPGGCQDGYKSSNCSIPCDDGEWGSNCAQTCGQCNGVDICDKVNGNCPNGCRPGWENTRCDKACDDGKFGDKCLRMCFCKNPPCNKTIGLCDAQGCVHGFQQTPTCEKPCPKNTFGSNCSNTCHCRNGAECDKLTGICPNNECAAGWKTNTCSVPCAGNEYGENCQKNCFCQNGTACDEINGACPNNGKCAPGYRGTNDRCNLVCEANKCGQDCVLFCSCFNQACMHTNCTCDGPCFPGYRNSTCKTPCPDGTFGLGCAGVCNCLDKVNEKSCDKPTGSCPKTGCALGFGGGNCTIPCDQSIREFGSGCKKKCYCETPDVCPTDTGICPNGCEPGYKTLNPNTCSEKCDDGFFGQNCDGRCHCKTTRSCDKVDGKCPVSCADGYTGYNCSTPCNSGYFGKDCLKQCHCRDGKPCDVGSGDCPNAFCAPGWKLRSCSEPDDGESDDNETLYIGLGIAGGALVLIIIIIVVGICVYKARRKRKDKDNRQLINNKKDTLPVVTPRSNGIPFDAVSTVSHCVFDPDWNPRYVREMKEEMQSQKNNRNSGPFEPEPEPTEPTPRDPPPATPPPRNQSPVDPTPPPLPPSSLKPNTGDREKDQWETLEKTRRKPIIDSYFPATKPENRNKNRNLDILPLQEHRVPLGNDPVADYINAVFVPGQHHSKEMIVTQIPTPVTIASFFRMISDQDVKLCIMLNPASSYVPYWPNDKETVSFHPFKVSHVETDHIDGVPVRKMTVANLQTGKTNNVKHIQLPGDQWTKGEATPGAVKSLVHLYKIMNKHKTKDNSPVLVHCEDGNERSGVFSTLTYVLDKLTEQKQLDVFNIVNNVRANRPQFITTIDQYKLLYEGAELYMETTGLRLTK